MARPLKVACLQTSPKPSVNSALEEALPLAKQAVSAGAQFLFLPEYCGGLMSEGSALVPPIFAENEHPFLAAFQGFDRAYGVWIMIGSIAISVPGGKIINRGFVLDAEGEIVSLYDKLHMFDIQISDTEVYRESARVAPGENSCLVVTGFAKIAHTICYDVRFPHLYRDLAKAGAEILCVPAAFTKKTGEAHWHVLNRARAIENGAYVVSPCAVGPVDGGGETYGHSLIIDPWGEVLVDGGDNHGVVTAKIDLDKVAKARGKIPSLTHDRPYNMS